MNDMPTEDILAQLLAAHPDASAAELNALLGAGTPGLAMQSGQMEAPQGELPPVPTKPASAAFADAPRPLGRPTPQVMEMDNGAMGTALALSPPALKAVGAALRAAPKVAGALAAGAGTAAATPTGESNFQFDDTNKERKKEIERLEQAINNFNKELATVAAKQSTAKGSRYANQLMDMAASLKKQLDDANSQRGTLVGQRDEEYKAAFDKWQQSEAARIESERPFREQYPNLYRMLPLLGWGGSVAGGVLGAKGGAPIKSAIGGALGGIPTSAAAAVGPTAYDAATLPTGSRYQKQAADWLNNKDNYYLSRVLPEVGVGAGLGMTAGKWGSQLTDLVRKLLRGSPAAEAPAAAAAKAPAAAEAPAAAQQLPATVQPGARALPTSGTEDLIWNPVTKSWVRPGSPSWMLPNAAR